MDTKKQMTGMSKKTKIGIFAVAVLTIFAGSSFASIKISTYAEANMQLNQDDHKNWHLNESSSGWNPKSMFELKLDIMPLKGFSIWFKTSATTSSDDRNDSLDFTFYDLHFRYQNKMGDGGFELTGYMREDSYFWIDQPLLRFTDNGSAWGQGDDRGDKGSMNGLYFNGWNILGLNLIKGFLVNAGMEGPNPKPDDTKNEKKFSGALRIRKDLLDGGLKLGATGVYYREYMFTEYDKDYTAYAFDLDTSLLDPFQISAEVGLSDAPTNKMNLGHETNQLTYKAELRGNFTLGRFGQTGFLASVYYASEYFHNRKGNGTDDYKKNRLIERLEIYYNFPLKAIYLKQNLLYSHPLTRTVDGNKIYWPDDNQHLWQYGYIGSTDAYLESYTELYIEFINGFKFKSYYKHTEGGEYSNGGVAGVWDSLLFQLEVENQFAKIKPMVLLLNINTEENRASAYGGEVLINLTDNIKFYTRFAMVAGSESNLYWSDEGQRNWYTFFAELQFLQLFSNTEMFLTFGNGDHTNDDLVHDRNGGILNGRLTEEKINFYVKFWM